MTGAQGTVSYDWEWDSGWVGDNWFYVPDSNPEGFYWLVVTVFDGVSSDFDAIEVHVDDSFSC